jgi:biotin/methionine sulfoxide reductase
MNQRWIQTASHWGVYSVAFASGEQPRVQPFHKDMRPSPIAGALPELAFSSHRIDQPYVREGFLRHRGASRSDRGCEAFVPISWDDALALVGDELLRVKATFGNEAIYGGSYGWASAGRLHHSPSVLKRFLGLHGGYVDKLGNHSFGAAMHIMPYVTGRGDINEQAMPWPLIVEHTRLMVMFGGAHLKNTQIESGGAVLHETADWFARAKAAGIQFVNVSPSRNDMAEELGADWISIRPNTDTALMLGLAHTIVTEGRHDRAFLTRYCAGYDPFEAYLLGREDGTPKDAQWAGDITGVDHDRIRSLARRMAETRTLISTSWSVQRAHHGEQPIWASVALASILGQIGLPGGGFSFGLAATSGIGAPKPRGIPMPTLPVGKNPIRNHVPVGRVTEMLLNPGKALNYNGKVITLPDIKLIYSMGGNPFHHNTNLNRFVQAWRKPETVIVHEPWWTPTAKMADIVLPATTTLERNDIQATQHSRFYIAMHKVIDPVGSSRNDFDILADIADRLGFRDAFTQGRDEMAWLRAMYADARSHAVDRGFGPPSFDEFWEAGHYEFAAPDQYEPFMAPYRSDPESKRLNTPSGKIELYSNTIEAFRYADCPPHPTWIEPAEWLGGIPGPYPIHLLSNQPSTRLHSQLDPSSLSRSSKVAGREPIRISEADAASRSINTGDIVRVYNDRGSFLAGAIVVDHLRPGVAQIATGAWYDPLDPNEPATLEKHGNPNVVTNDIGTSQLAQSSVAQTALVEIARYADAPPVTAFDRPKIL